MSVLCLNLFRATKRACVPILSFALSLDKSSASWLKLWLSTAWESCDSASLASCHQGMGENSCRLCQSLYGGWGVRCKLSWSPFSLVKSFTAFIWSLSFCRALCECHLYVQKTQLRVQICSSQCLTGIETPIGGV